MHIMNISIFAIFLTAYLAQAHFKGFTKQVLLIAILATSIVLTELPMVTLGVLAVMLGVWAAKWVKEYNYELHAEYYGHLSREYLKVLNSLPDFYEFDPKNEDDREHIFVVKEGKFAGYVFSVTQMTQNDAEYKYSDLGLDPMVNLDATDESTDLANTFFDMIRMREELEG